MLAVASGWALAPVVGWLINEGRQIGEPTQLTDELCRRLVEEGVPLWRLRFSFQTLHPQVAACAFTWTRAQNSTESCLLHGIPDSEAFFGNPIGGADATEGAAQCRIEHLDPELHQMTVLGGIDYLVAPFTFSTGQANAFIVATDHPGGFSDTDAAKFQTLTAFLAPILEVIAVRRIARTLLDTYVGHRTGGKVLDGRIKRGDGETIHAALWFSDLRDFTRLSETLPPDRLLAMLNAYFELLAEAVTGHGGEVLRFVGDAMLVLFPVELGDDVHLACSAALDAALDAFQNLARLNDVRLKEGEPPIRFGVGLHVGKVIYGNVGSPDRLDFTVMGPAVNRAARIEGLTKALGVPLLFSADFAAQVTPPARSLGHHRLKGVAEPQEVLTLTEELSRFVEPGDKAADGVAGRIALN